MKKIFLCAVLFSVIIASCKKKQNDPSIIVTASFPTITFSPSIYFSIPVGGQRPTGIATAYDSFYKQSLSVVLVDSTVNTLVPGLYEAIATSTSKYGYISYANYYVAVTNEPSSEDLSGEWYQRPNADTTATIIQKLANGFYSTSNITGVDLNTTAATAATFVVINDTTIQFDNTVAGSVTSPTGILNMKIHIYGDTTMTYGVLAAGDSITFSKN